MEKNQYISSIRLLVAIIMGLTCTHAQAATYPDMPVSGPTDQFPTGFQEFTPQQIDAEQLVHPEAPEIAEWTRQNQPGDTMALTGEALSAFDGVAAGRDTQFAFYGRGTSVVDGSIQRLNGRLCAVTLPEDLPPNEMYLMWPRNEYGFGEPVGINQTETWWIGPDLTWVGQTFSVYGRNLDLGDGLCQAYIDGYGWVPNTAVNPYKADFVVPSLANGTYSVYVHNGHGGKYGWSDPVTLTIRGAIVYNGDRLTVTSAAYGAIPNDGKDDYDAIAACIAASRSGDEIYFPAGRYLSSRSIQLPAGRLLAGDGMDTTMIMTADNFIIPNTSLQELLVVLDNTMVQDIELNAGDFKGGGIGRAVANVGGGGQFNNYTRWERVRFSGLNEESGVYSGNSAVNMGSNDRYRFFTDCEFIETGPGSRFGGARQLFFKNCNFLGANDSNAMFQRDGDECAMEGCTAGPLSSASLEARTWGKGRWLSSGNQVGFNYFGDNVSTNMFPRHPNWMLTNAVASVDGGIIVGWNPDFHGAAWDAYDLTLSADISDVLLPGLGNDMSLFKHVPSGRTWAVYATDQAAGKVRLIWRQGATSPFGIIGAGDLCAVRENPDDNSGEQFLFEGSTSEFRGLVTTVTDASKFKIAGLGFNYTSGNSFCIVDGKGMGQTAEIASINASTGEIVLTKPLRVTPDNTSLCKIGDFIRNMAFYNNVQNGHGDWDTEISATCAVNLYGSGFNICYDGNTASEMTSGFVMLSHTAGGILGPEIFNYIANNNISETRTGVLLHNEYTRTLPAGDYNFFGNTFRNNTISDCWTGIKYYNEDSSFRFDLNVIEGSTFAGCGTSVRDAANVHDQVLVSNAFVGKGTGTGFTFIGDNDPPVLRKNVWSQFSSAYGGNVPGAIFETPIRVVRLNNSIKSMAIPLWHSGTVLSNLSVEAPSESWLEVGITNQIGGVSDPDTDWLICVVPDGQSGDKSSVVTLTDGINTKQITVYFSDSGSSENSITIPLNYASGTRLRATLEDKGSGTGPGQLKDLGELDITQNLTIENLAEGHAYELILYVYNTTSGEWIPEKPILLNILLDSR